jgi:glutamine phosphoribosylpyrophosphate amidotransferase
MCGVIGFDSPNTDPYREVLARLLVESSYRGLHSLGFAWLGRQSMMLHHSPPLIEREAVRELLDLALDGLPHISLIGHTRYCTSDPESPLPVIRDGVAIVLNGVISQETSENWPNTRDLPYEGQNDAEIALRFAQDGALAKHGGSFAIGILYPEGDQTWVRNGHRPLWCGSWMDARFHCSTRDIAKRALGSKLTSIAEAPVVDPLQLDFQHFSNPVKPCAL